MSKTERAVRLAEKRLKMAFREEDFYQAQELLVSLTNRLRGQQQFARAKQALEEGMDQLLRYHKDNAVAQLVKVYIEVLEESPDSHAADAAEYFVELSDRFRDNASLVSFLRHTVSATTPSDGQHGDCRLHLRAAKALSAAKPLRRKEALEQLVLAGHQLDSDGLKEVVDLSARLLTQDSEVSEPDDSDLSAAAAKHVLRVAAFTSRDLAEAVYDSIIDLRHGETSDAMVMVRYVLQTLTRDAAPLLKEVREAYKSVIDADMDKLLNKIAKRYYNVSSERAQMPGLLGALFGSGASSS